MRGLPAFYQIKITLREGRKDEVVCHAGNHRKDVPFVHATFEKTALWLHHFDAHTCPDRPSLVGTVIFGCAVAVLMNFSTAPALFQLPTSHQSVTFENCLKNSHPQPLKKNPWRLMGSHLHVESRVRCGRSQ